MLRVINLSRAQPTARNLSLISKRYQQSSTSSGPSKTQSTSNTLPSSSKTQTASTTPSSSNPTKTTTTTSPPSTPPPPSSRTVPPSSSSSYPSGSAGGSSGTVKTIAYGVALGLGVTLLYAEYDNGSFRRKVESTLPLSSTILGGLDKIIDPVFGRQKEIDNYHIRKLPDISAVTDKLPDKEQIKKAGEQVKDAANAVYNKLPSQKQIEKAGEKAKDAINDAYDRLPDAKTVKKTLVNAKEQVEDTAKSVGSAVKDALPTTKGLSGEQSRRGNDPVFLEEAGEVATPPPIKRK